MDRFTKGLIVLALAGCNSRPPLPAVLQDTELEYRFLLEEADPLDPSSVLFTVHQDGRVTWKGKSLSPEEIAARAPRGTADVNLTPILIDAHPDAQFSVVRDLLEVLTGKPSCVNYTFLVSTPRGPGGLLLPMPSARGMGYYLFEGRSKQRHIGASGDTKLIDLVVHAGKDGQIEVREINLRIPDSVPAIYFPEPGENPTDIPKPPSVSWTGPHPPLGPWSPEMLKNFLSRPDVRAHSPYILFEITTKERVSEVLRCLAMLRSLGDVAIVPDILTRH